MKLARREKYVIGIGGAAIGIFFFMQLVVFPLLDSRTRLQRGVEAKEAGLRDMFRMQAEHRNYQSGSQGIEKFLANRKRGFTLFSFLEQAAGAAAVKDNIKYMKPSTSKGSGPYKESMVEIKLETVTMKQLVGYLHRIESPRQVTSIKRISIKGNKKEPGYLDVVLQVLTLSK
jgi:general secretion pathway protein M